MAYLENILSVLARATARQYTIGGHWYDDARNLALELSPNDVWRGAGVIAAFSPVCPWERNVKLARLTFETGRATGHTNMFNAFAQRIYDGEHPLNVLNGDKTRAFTAAIADPHTTIATIDRHAHDIAMGRVFSDKERKIGKRVFREMSAAYNEAATFTGLSVSAAQAITWVVWREEKAK